MIYKSISFSEQKKRNYLLKKLICKEKQISLCLRFCCIVAKQVSGALRVNGVTEVLVSRIYIK